MGQHFLFSVQDILLYSYTVFFFLMMQQQKVAVTNKRGNSATRVMMIRARALRETRTDYGAYESASDDVISGVRKNLQEIYLVFQAL